MVEFRAYAIGLSAEKASGMLKPSQKTCLRKMRIGFFGLKNDMFLAIIVRPLLWVVALFVLLQDMFGRRFRTMSCFYFRVVYDHQNRIDSSAGVHFSPITLRFEIT